MEKYTLILDIHHYTKMICKTMVKNMLHRLEKYPIQAQILKYESKEMPESETILGSKKFYRLWVTMEAKDRKNVMDTARTVLQRPDVMEFEIREEVYEL